MSGAQDHPAMDTTTPTVLPSPQDRIRTLLERAGIPYKEIKVFGCQVLVKCWSQDAATRFYALLHRCCTAVRKVTRWADYNIVNENTVLRPTRHRVWLVGGRI